MAMMDTSKLPPARVTEYVVSYTFDAHKGGSKSSHFVSMKFATERPVTEREAEALAFASSVTVTRAAVYQALARGALTVEEANEIISSMKANHEHIYAKKLEPAVSDPPAGGGG